MLLRVPEQVHELALENGFHYFQTGSAVACSNCDRAIPRLDWTYYIPVSGSQNVDFWCAACTETKLPELLSAGRAPR